MKYELAFRRPYLRCALVGLVIFCLSGFGLFLPPAAMDRLIFIRGILVRMTPERIRVASWALWGIGSFFFLVCLQIRRFVSFSLILDGDTLRVPPSRTPWRSCKLKEIRKSDVLLVSLNKAADHLVINTRSERILLPWYWLPKGVSLADVSEKIKSWKNGATD